TPAGAVGGGRPRYRRPGAGQAAGVEQPLTAAPAAASVPRQSTSGVPARGSGAAGGGSRVHIGPTMRRENKTGPRSIPVSMCRWFRWLKIALVPTSNRGATVMLDMRAHRRADVLPGRDADLVADWLRATTCSSVVRSHSAGGSG